MKESMHNYLFIFFFFLCATASAQDTSKFAYPIELDEIVIQDKAFDVQWFIRRVRTDTSFYKAFRSLRVTTYSAINEINVYDKKGKVKASLYSKTRQTASRGCRSMKTEAEEVKGDFYKRNKEYRYYTAELYAYLFFTKGTVCGENDLVGPGLNQKGKGQIERSKAQLKQLIFNPGSKIGGIPGMGEKAAIFEPDQAERYDFKIYSEKNGGIDCYVFKAVPKKGQEGKVVYDELTTWFRKTDYSIVARDYSLSFRTLAYDFKVRMKVRTEQVGRKLLPTRIDYDGNWHVFTQDRERVKFTALFSY
jgi:hypothetical protein